MAKFKSGDIVINIQTKHKGMVCQVMPPARGKQIYRVRFNENIESCLEQNLDFVFEIENPFERVRKGIYGNRDQFVLVNTTHKINNSNNNVLSSLKASKTLFKAYQFKPLLKFLNSNTRRLLIADEVGLGKTIEAGHIMLELKARGEFKSALIVCPNSLKNKWQTELKEKFGLDFKIYNSLNEAVEDLKIHPQNARGILNYDKVRVKKKDGQESGKKKNKGEDDLSSNCLIDFLHSGQKTYSIVLCDEAHKLKNHNTLQYQGMKEILNYANSTVFLTATPIMLGEEDLYNLMHLLEPISYSNREVFKNMINSNRPFIQAISMVNANEPLQNIQDLLLEGEITQIHKINEDVFEKSEKIHEKFKGIRLYEEILRLLEMEDSPALRARLQNKLSDMSSINNVFSRTRKKEVSIDERQHTVRDAHKRIVTLHPDERMVYDEIIDNYIETQGGYEYNEYGDEIIPKGAILGLIQKKRMVASSVNAYRLYVESDCDNDAYCRRVEGERNLEDSKIEHLVEIINGVKAAGGDKLIVFSIFKFTVRYLAIQLKKLGYKVFAIHGDIKVRETVIQQFKECEEFALLLSTEVGSEGLDMQFCSHLVNYDLPWNPMVVEQRIGRIDRFGQKADKVHIYNMVVANSIQEIVYDRLLDRIGVFKGVIGDLEMILEENGGAIRQLEHDIYSLKLTKEEQEKRVIDITKAFETQKIHLNEVEKGMTNALTNDIYFQNEINRIRERELYVTDAELKNYIRMLIMQHLKTCVLEQIDSQTYSIKVPKSTPKVINSFLTTHQPVGEEFDELFNGYKQQILQDFLETGKRILTFNQEFAFENKCIDYVNIYNPFIIAASVYFKESISSIGNTFQLKFELPDSIELKRGEYFLAVYTIVRKQRVLNKEITSETLVPVLYNIEDDVIIDDEELNMNVFGKIQQKALNMATEDGQLIIPEQVYVNMECEFTQYISDYVEEMKNEIAIKEDSQKEMSIRQYKQHYDLRIEKERENVGIAEKNLEIIQEINSDEEVAKAKNLLQLARNRLNLLEKQREEAIERVNSIQAPELLPCLVSLNRLKIV